MWHSFLGQEKKKRGHLIVYRNKKTDMIVELDIVEDVNEQDMSSEFSEEAFSKKCDQD